MRRARSGTDRLLVYRDRDGWRQVRAEQINERFKELAGVELTGKDLRTWHATVLAAAAYAAAPPAKIESGIHPGQGGRDATGGRGAGQYPRGGAQVLCGPTGDGCYREGRSVDLAVARIADEADRAALERSVIRLLEHRRV